MTRGDIIATLIAFTLVAGVIVTVSIYSLIQSDSGLARLLAASGILVTVGVVIVTYVQALREVRRRRRVDL
jgi:hypothetical protein